MIILLQAMHAGFTVLTEPIVRFLFVSAFISTPRHLAHSPRQTLSTSFSPVSSKATRKHLHLRRAPPLSPASHWGHFYWRWDLKQLCASPKSAYTYCHAVFKRLFAHSPDMELTLYHWTLSHFDSLAVICCCCDYRRHWVCVLSPWKSHQFWFELYVSCPPSQTQFKEQQGLK